MTETTRWQLWSHVVSITKANFRTVTVDPAHVWTIKDKEGRTEWDKLQQFAADGWELVSVTPITTTTTTSYTSTLLYSFKRPLP